MHDNKLLGIYTDIVRTLATRVQFLTPKHVKLGWFGEYNNAEASSRNAVDWLLQRELIRTTTIEVRTTAPVTSPVFAWCPSAPEPSWDDWEDLAQRLANRWSRELTTVRVLYLGPRGAALFGVLDQGLGRPCEWSHDFLTTEVYIHYRSQRSMEVSRWQGEAARPKWGYKIGRMKDPDVMLIDKDGAIERVIEIAGKYSASHLYDLHRHCAGDACDRIESWIDDCQLDHFSNPYYRQEIGYELW